MARDDDEFENSDVKIGSARVTLGSELGTGNEGTVYEISGSSSEVVKIFETERRSEKQRKVKEMVREPPEIPSKLQSGPPALVWPIESVHTVLSDDFLGYSMTRLEMDDFRDAQKYASEALDHSRSTAETRYKAALDLAIKVALVHSNDHAIGDMHHKNILVNDGSVTLIDCDGYHISGKYRDFGGDTVYYRYEPPDTRSSDDDVEAVRLSDRFGLAVHIFQFVMGGQHPFVAVGSQAVAGSTKNAIQGNVFPYHDPDPGRLEPPPHAPDYGILPGELKAPFEAALVSGKSEPEKRPTAMEWVKALAQASPHDTSGIGQVGIDDDDDDDDVDRREKWKRQRERRKKRYGSSQGGSATSRSRTGDGNGSSSGSSSGNGGSNRDSTNWAEEIRNKNLSGGNSDSSGTSTSYGGSGSNASVGSSTPSTPSTSAWSTDSDSDMNRVLRLVIVVGLLVAAAYGLLITFNLLV
jgi:hypothetical protein